MIFKMSGSGKMAPKRKASSDPCFFEASKMDADQKRKAAKSQGDPKSFRLSGHKFFLTYSGLPEDFGTKEELLSQIKDWSLSQNLVEYSIGKEVHPNPSDPSKPVHFHAYFCVEKKKSIKNPAQYFPWKGHRGDYQPVGGRRAFKDIPPAEQRKYVIEYTMKDGDYIQDLNEKEAEKVDEDVYEVVAEQSTSVDEGLQTFRERNPKEFFMRFNSIKPALEWIHSQKKAPLEFDIYDFDRSVKPLDFDECPNWVVYGKSDAGKSRWVKACLAHAGFTNPLVVSQLDGFKKFKKGYHDSIICEEMDFRNAFTKDGAPNKNHTGVDNAKNILEFEDERDIHCRTSNASIPAGVPKVFVNNSEDGNIFPEGTTDQDKVAIKKRNKRLKISGSLYPYKENDRTLREGKRFSELHARKATRAIFRGIRQAARDGDLKLGSDPCPNNDAIIRAKELSSKLSDISSICTAKTAELKRTREDKMEASHKVMKYKDPATDEPVVVLKYPQCEQEGWAE